MTVGKFRQPLWIVPLAIAAVVAIFGWWGNRMLRHTIEQQLKAQLTTTLVANRTSLEIWLTDQKRLAAELAGEPQLRTRAVAILGQSQAADPVELGQFSRMLQNALRVTGYSYGQVVATNYMVVASTGRPLKVSEMQTNKYAELFEGDGRPLIITPYKPEYAPFFVTNRGGGRGFGGRGFGGRGTNGNRGGFGGFGRGFGQTLDNADMQVAAPIRNTNFVVVGALALIINPAQEFTKIISATQYGKSGETYAFDESGRLISESRFDDELKQLKILEDPNTNSALIVTLRDPTAAPVDGIRPLTRIASDAISGDGELNLELEPSADYRGVMVVGASRWLPNYGFGIATQIDAKEAFEPLRVLKLLFTMLCLMLLLCATGMFVFTYANFTWRRRLSEAELRLKQLGQYTLEEKIGEGGMGIVYRARHALLRRETAVKLLTPDRADPVSVARFEREVVMTCQLTHPNTIQIYDYGHTPDGIFYYAMEFLRGLNLHDLVGRFGAQPEGRVIYILTQVCESLSEAHGMGLVHRDIKPANIFLCSRGGMPDWVKVLDFGLVRRYDDNLRDRSTTTSGKGLEGTPWFMPPESIKDSTKSDPRSDIYSVAAVGYYLLTGRYVFEGESIFELCEQHLKETPLAPSQYAPNRVSAELDRIILRCLEKDPDLRPQTALELRHLLLGTSQATAWTDEARVEWWARYQVTAAPKPGEAGYIRPTPTDDRVNIDLASRM